MLDSWKLCYSALCKEPHHQGWIHHEFLLWSIRLQRALLYLRLLKRVKRRFDHTFSGLIFEDYFLRSEPYSVIFHNWFFFSLISLKISHYFVLKSGELFLNAKIKRIEFFLYCQGVMFIIWCKILSILILLFYSFKKYFLWMCKWTEHVRLFSFTSGIKRG